MIYCPGCGAQNDNSSIFCGNCGTKISDKPAMKPQSQQYGYGPQPSRSAQQSSTPYQTSDSISSSSTGSSSSQFYSSPRRTTDPYQYSDRSKIPKPGLLSFVIIIHWIIFGLLVLFTLIILVIFFPFGILLGLIAALEYWIAKGLSNLNNNARTVALILSGLGLIINIINVMNGESFPLLGILIGSITVYTLGFHQETVQLFARYN